MANGPRIRNISPDELRRLFESPEIQQPTGGRLADVVNLADTLSDRSLKRRQDEAIVQELERKLAEEEQRLQDQQLLAQQAGQQFAAPVEQAAQEAIDPLQAGPEIGPLPEADMQAIEQAKALGEAQFRQGTTTTTGKPPRSIEAFFVEQANQGKMTIDEAIANIQKAEPTIRGFEDNEGRKGIVNVVTGEVEVFKKEKTPSETGKTTRAQFTPEEQKAIKNARVEFAKSEFVKKQGSLLREFGKIDALVRNNPKGAIGPTQTQVSKVVAGEVGRLTDQDIERNVPTRDLAEKLKQALRTWKSGDFTNVTRERYGQLLDILRKEMARSLNTELEDVTRSVVEFETEGADPEVIRREIGRGLVPFIDEFLEPEQSDQAKAIEQLSDEELEARIQQLRSQQRRP